MEREIRLNGICGVIFLRSRIEKLDSAFCLPVSSCRAKPKLSQEASKSYDMDPQSEESWGFRMTASGNVLTIARDARSSRPRRRPSFRRRIIRRCWHASRRALLQHFDDRLSGSADRSILSRTNCGNDLSAHWKLWDQCNRPVTH